MIHSQSFFNASRLTIERAEDCVNDNNGREYQRLRLYIDTDEGKYHLTLFADDSGKVQVVLNNY